MGRLILPLLLVWLGAPLIAEAQQAERIARIGFLSLDIDASPHLAQALRAGLRDLDYVEGCNVVLEIRSAKALGITIAPSLLHRADGVIE